MRIKFHSIKNSLLPDNSIIGWGSVYSSGRGKNLKAGCIYAGNPARKVKENINWNSNGAKFGYIENKL